VKFLLAVIVVYRVSMRECDSFGAGSNPVDHPNMTWQYIAGFFDGEGSLCLSNGRYFLSISQTNEEVLVAIREFAGVGRVHKVTKRKQHWRDAWIYQIGKRAHILSFLMNIVDHLIVKRDLVQLAILRLRYDIANHKPRFKRERAEMFAAMYADGKSFSDIQRETGVDRGIVRKALIRLGVYP
jgi:hypothetical protein